LEIECEDTSIVHKKTDQAGNDAHPIPKVSFKQQLDHDDVNYA
jgi:hypothetical protein